MKLKNILGIALSALLLTACSDDESIGSLDCITVDNTFVTIPEKGGDVTVTINAVSDWAFDKYVVVGKDTLQLPTWLTASQLSGGAGETKVVFHADAAVSGRETQLRISVAGQKQFIAVRQGSLDASKAKISEVLSGTAGKVYRVTGVITRTYSNYEQYGNYYIKDESGEILVYGTADKNGKLKNYPVKSWGLEIGDEVTIEGGTSLYNNVIQFANVTIIELKKSLLKVVSDEPTLPLEGGEMEVKVAYKGNGAFFEIDKDSKDWIGYKDVSYIAGVKTLYEQNPADTVVFKFNIAPNTSDKRKGTIVFKSYSGSNSSEITYTVNQEGVVAVPPSGDGTEADPYNVSAALAAATETAALGIYVKGIVCDAPTEVNEKYGSCTYYISADGKSTNRLQIYSGLFLKGEKFTSADQVKVGDEVIVVGDLKLFNGNAELDKNNWIYSLNGDTGAE